MGLFDIFRVGKIKAENEALKQKLQDLHADEYWQVKEHLDRNWRNKLHLSVIKLRVPKSCTRASNMHLIHFLCLMFLITTAD